MLFMPIFSSVAPVLAKTYLTRTYANPAATMNCSSGSNSDSGSKGGVEHSENASASAADADADKGSRQQKSQSQGDLSIYATERLELADKIRKGQEEIENLQKKFLASQQRS